MPFVAVAAKPLHLFLRAFPFDVDSWYLTFVVEIEIGKSLRLNIVFH
jgi:hypothetical protein